MTIRWSLLATVATGLAPVVPVGTVGPATAADATTVRVNVASDGTQANGSTLFGHSISADGRYVAFDSYATNLVPDDTNNAEDVFVRDRWAGATIRVSLASDGTQGNNLSYAPGITSDGREIAFVSDATNLVPGDTNNRPDVFVRHLAG